MVAQSPDQSAQTFSFQAETKQLLNLVIHSLYTNKDIFLRELVSNASDALDKLRFESLTHPDLLPDTTTLEIRLEVDKKTRTLSVTDNGIGMSREEVVANIGTIAKSGTRTLLEEVQKEGKSPEALSELIGRFGVGFYSAFMVANKVTLTTRKAGEENSTMWESTGDGEYSLQDTSRDSCGTSITLHLKASDPDNGIEDYTDQWTIANIIKLHSDFVTYPIKNKQVREEVERDSDGKPKEGAKTNLITEDKTLNSMKPLWTRQQSEVSEEEYTEFYKHLSHDWTAPLKTLKFRAEGRFEFQALIFLPAQAPFDMSFHASPFGLQLYAQRVLIMEQCEELIPRYLRFLKGVVDSADLPLNVSRQRLQQDRHISQMRSWLTKKVLDELRNLASSDADEYLKFWEPFGRVLKEGLSTDPENKDKIAPLLLFPSSKEDEKLVSLKDYVERMPLAQPEIFYLTGESLNAVKHSPHLEAFTEKGHEVLYLTDPVDELVVQSLPEFDGKKLKSIGKGTVQLGTESEREEAEQELQAKSQNFTALLSALQEHLAENIKEVRLSNRLRSSPVCLVSEDDEHSPQMERLLQQAQQNVPKQKRIMELNPHHQLLERIRTIYEEKKDSQAIKTYAELLLGYGLLAEGSEIADPVSFNKHLVQLMENNLQDT